MTAGKAVSIVIARFFFLVFLASFINLVDPAKIVNLVSELEIGTQERASLDCQAEGNPQPTYTWTPCDPERSVCHESVLNFQASNKSVYTFTCRVANSLGSDTRNTTLCKLGRARLRVCTCLSICNDH